MAAACEFVWLLVILNPLRSCAELGRRLPAGYGVSRAVTYRHIRQRLSMPDAGFDYLASDGDAVTHALAD